MQNAIPIRLSQLTSGIAAAMEAAFRDRRFWVIAEVSNHSFKSEKGYHNFELVEKDPASSDVIARIAAKAWGNGTRNIVSFEEKTGQKFGPKIQVLVLVALEYHSVFGISANVLDIDSNFTLGALEQQRHATLERLVAQNEFIEKIEGEYITANKRLAFRPVLQKIALLSSSISAGAEDFRHTLENNAFGYAFRIDDYFVSVQGDKNAGQLLDKLIEIYNSGIPYDALVITRGGGAQSDFLLFDNYRIARAVAKFPIPIITGIGHQKNQSITDLMVHSQTKTPTKAAELVIAHNRGFEQRLQAFQKDILIGAQRLLLNHQNDINGLKQLLLHGARDILVSQNTDLSSLKESLARHSQALIANRSKKIVRLSATLAAEVRITLQKNKSNLAGAREKVGRTQQAFIKNKRKQLENFSTTVKLMSPANILKKGYAMVRVGGKVVSHPESIGKGTPIEVIFTAATLQAIVENKIKHDGTDANI
jgi:exodeoxyribonuclease VII large subunit